MTTPRTIRLSPDDNVVVAVDAIAQGATAVGLTARERIPRGHKMAVAPIRADEPVRKYGQIIGFAKKHIAPGDWVHEHNVGLHDFARDYRFAEDAKNDEVRLQRVDALLDSFNQIFIMRAEMQVGKVDYASHGPAENALGS